MGTNSYSDKSESEGSSEWSPVRKKDRVWGIALDHVYEHGTVRVSDIKDQLDEDLSRKQIYEVLKAMAEEDFLSHRSKGDNTWRLGPRLMKFDPPEESISNAVK